MLDRRLLMAQGEATPPPGGGIVTDGLVFHLDGTDRGGVPGEWKELISGRNFDCYNVQEDATGIGFSGNNNSYASMPDMQGFTDFGTIQVAFAPQNTSGVVYSPKVLKVGINTKSYFAFGIIGNAALFAGHPAPLDGEGENSKKYLSFKMNWARGAKYTLSASRGIFYANKEDRSTLAPPDLWGSQSNALCYLGKRQQGNGLAHKLYAIRIYDRVLTEAEILQNQQYDIDTYFGGVTP